MFRLRGINCQIKIYNSFSNKIVKGKRESWKLNKYSKNSFQNNENILQTINFISKNSNYLSRIFIGCLTASIISFIILNRDDQKRNVNFGDELKENQIQNENMNIHHNSIVDLNKESNDKYSDDSIINIFKEKLENWKQEIGNETIYAESKFDVLKKEAPIYRICLTGGPSSGKTSSMSYLRDKLSGLGFQVFVVTEMATLLLSGGASYRPDMDMDELLAFESALMKNQMAVEDSYIDIAKASKRPTVILCDRGVLDAKAYMSQEIFESLLDFHGWNETKLKEGRYDAVIHMITAAIGAEKFYTKENNPSRMETAEEAASLDHLLRQSYIGHPNYTIIDNSTNFEGKVERVYSYVGSIVGLPKSISTKKKYLLKRNIREEEFPPFLKYEIHEMTQGFLRENDQNAQTRIRKRSQKGTHTYSISTKRTSSDGKEETVSVRPISAKIYYELSDILDPTMPSIKKVIKSFVYGEYYFELATYMLHDDDSNNPVVLQVEAPKDDIELPHFLKSLIEKDVTPERETEDYYGSYYFSLQKRNQL